MKALQLTEKQKEMLLEMAKTMFPEYKYFNLHDGVCDLCTENTLDFAKIEKPTWNAWQRIHWFEFCITYLSDKILYLKSKSLSRCKLNHSEMLMEIMKNFYKEDSIHPIDYLYEQFNKLMWDNKINQI